MDPIGIKSKTDVSKIDFNEILHIYKFMQKPPSGIGSFHIDLCNASKSGPVTLTDLKSWNKEVVSSYRLAACPGYTHISACSRPPWP